MRVTVNILKTKKTFGKTSPSPRYLNFVLDGERGVYKSVRTYGIDHLLSRKTKMAEGLIKSSRKTPTKFDNGFEPTFDSDGTPSCLTWNIEDVADWVEFLGFKQYRVRKQIDVQTFDEGTCLKKFVQVL